ncbi:MAG: hypothetical protein ACRD8O_05390, partial [Bryobacteraceae bacterium]
MATNDPRVTFTEFNLREAPGSLLIRIDDEFVRQMERHLNGMRDPSQLPVGGILIGSTVSAGAETITISGFAREAAFRSAVKAISGDASGRGIVGLYRVSTEGTETLGSEDSEWFGWLFPAGDRLLLKIHPDSDGVPTAVVYFGRNGVLELERRTVEFPLNLGELGAESAPEPGMRPVVAPANGSDRTKIHARAVTTTAPPANARAPSSTGPVRPDVDQSGSRSGRTLFIVAGAAILVVAGVVAIGGGNLQRVDPAAPAAGPLPQSVTTASAPAPSPEVTPPPAASSNVTAAPKPNQAPVAAPAPVKPVEEPKSIAARQAPRPFVMEPRSEIRRPEVIELPVPAAPQGTSSALPGSLPSVQAPNPVPPPKPDPPPAVTTPPASNTPSITNPALTSAPSSASANFVPPRPLRPVTPSVPPAALRSLPGEVVIGIRVDVDKEGAVLNATPVDTTTPTLKFMGTHIATAVKKWRFEP